MGDYDIQGASRAVSEGIRALNHATIGSPIDPRDADMIISDLITALERIPQLLTQISNGLKAQQENGQLEVTSPAGTTDPEKTAVTLIRTYSDATMPHLERSIRSLQAIRFHTSTLTLK